MEKQTKWTYLVLSFSAEPETGIDRRPRRCDKATADERCQWHDPNSLFFSTAVTYINIDYSDDLLPMC